jgi:hypothetical protein
MARVGTRYLSAASREVAGSTPDEVIEFISIYLILPRVSGEQSAASV